MSYLDPFKKEPKDKYITPQEGGYGRLDIEKFAEKIAKRLKYKSGANLKPVIESIGGSINLLKGGEWSGVQDGSILVHGIQDFQIFIPQHTGPLRDRFTIAHELGHYFLHAEQGEKRIIIDRFGSEDVEWEANYFAAAFLMPKAEVIKQWEKRKNASLVAGAFNVSLQTMRVRLHTFDLDT